MANMQNDGLDGLIASLKELGEDSNKKLIKEMLEAGSEPVKDSWKKELDSVIMPNGTVKTYPRYQGNKVQHFKMKSRTTGITKNSVNGKITLNKSAIGYYDVYPKGTKPNGKGKHKTVRTAEIAFILEYGKSGQVGKRFVDTAVENSENECISEMDRVFTEYLKKKGLT